jgi:hypothetical protein
MFFYWNPFLMFFFGFSVLILKFLNPLRPIAIFCGGFCCNFKDCIRMVWNEFQFFSFSIFGFVLEFRASYFFDLIVLWGWICGWLGMLCWFKINYNLTWLLTLTVHVLFSGPLKCELFTAEKYDRKDSEELLLEIIILVNCTLSQVY